MLNSIDKRIIIRTSIIYMLCIFVFIYGVTYFNKIQFITENPQIKAVIALLLVVIISYLKIPTEFTFLICGILGSFIMGISLTKYAEFLSNEAGSTSIFMIAISGAVVAALARGDLKDEMEKSSKFADHEKYLDLKHQVSVFCLFDKLQNFIKRIKMKSEIIAVMFFLLQNMLLFVSSVVSASTFSAMFKTDNNKSDEENTYINAGILCMCASGCLLMFFFMKSPWWLFFLGFENDLNVHIQLPISTLIYGFFSFIHGYFLLSKANPFSIEESEDENQIHPLTQRHFYIYESLIVIFLLFTMSAPIALIGKSDAKSSDINEGIITILILILSGIIAAAIITRRIMKKSLIVQHDGDTINELRKLVMGDSKSDSGIKSVVGLLILMITILSFRDMISMCVNSGISNSNGLNVETTVNLMSTDSLIAFLGCLITLLIVTAIGWILGSNFGAFSIGLIIFSIISGNLVVLNNTIWKRWIIESIIIVSAFSNQTSPASSNAATLVKSSDEDSRNIQIKAWKVKSFWGLTAKQVQILGMVICVILSGILTLLGIQ